MYRANYSGGLRMQELGRLDRAIYGMVILLLLVFGGLMIPVFLMLENQIPFLDTTVIGYSNRAGILGLALACVLIGFVIAALIGGRTRKFPIFGAAGVTYGGPEWTPVYPLLMSTRNAPEEVRKIVREGRQLVCIPLAGALIAAAIFGVSLCSGNRLFEDGSIRWLWGFGWEVERFEPEDVEQVTVSVRHAGSSRGISERKYEIVLEFQMTDDRTCSFFLRDFRRDGIVSQVGLLEQLLRRYEDAELIFEGGGHFAELIQDQQYPPEDQAILRELFGA